MVRTILKYCVVHVFSAKVSAVESINWNIQGKSAENKNGKIPPIHDHEVVQKILISSVSLSLSLSPLSPLSKS